MKVQNKKIIRNLSVRSMKASKVRNVIAVLAIMLTTILFTSFFTILFAINDSYEQSNFKQIGNYAHGTFLSITEEQAENIIENISNDSTIEEYGKSVLVGTVSADALQSVMTEVHYSDKNAAKWNYCMPAEGDMPKSGTNEAAVDSKVLSLLGIEKKTGTQFELVIDVNGVLVTKTFTLCGWWESSELQPVKNVLVSENQAEDIQKEYEKLILAQKSEHDVLQNENNTTENNTTQSNTTESSTTESSTTESNITESNTTENNTTESNTTESNNNNITNNFVIYVMFKNSYHIKDNMTQILRNCDLTENNVEYEENWGYTSAQLAQNVEPLTLIAMLVVLGLILLTGYLIIYNIFQISVSNDIQFLGLLKTIGTTGTQIQHLITYQAWMLAGMGIPFGLLGGYLIGVRLTQVILDNLNGLDGVLVSANPVVFVASALFSMLTVIISCKKPGKLAAQITPIEAVRYIDHAQYNLGLKDKRKSKRFTKRKINKNHTKKKHSNKIQSNKYRSDKRRSITPFSMAIANLGRNKNKTIVTMLSLSLSVVLFSMTMIFTSGFDLGKYIKIMQTDFIVANEEFLEGQLWDDTKGISPEAMEQIEKQVGIEDAGYVYGNVTTQQQFVSEEYYRNKLTRYLGEDGLGGNIKESVDWNVEQNKLENGLIQDDVELYGMDAFIIDKLTVINGDISKLKKEGNYIAAVYLTDDYGNPEKMSNYTKVGDVITIRYVEEMGWVDKETGEQVDTPDLSAYVATGEMSKMTCRNTAVKYKDVTYEVVAEVAVPNTLSYRMYSSSEQFVLNSKTYCKATGTDEILLYACDTKEDATSDMEAFLKYYTEEEQETLGYESKEIYRQEFAGFKQMFMLLGGLMSFIVGIVGVLNFFNAILTGIFARKREFAILQSVGMTGKQLKQMLIWEGLNYTIIAMILVCVLNVVLGPVVANVLENTFWFFTYHMNLLPVIITVPIYLLLGVTIPIVSYHFVAKQSVVERLRNID